MDPPQDPLPFLYSFDFFSSNHDAYRLSPTDLCVAANPMALMEFHVVGTDIQLLLAISGSVSKV